MHLPKYRDFMGDSSLDEAYLSQWQDGSASYLITGDEGCLVGVAAAADAILQQALQRNVPESKMGTEHACSHYSNAGTTSAYVAPALFTPAFGGLNVHYGRAPWVNVLYYAQGKMGLPGDMAALYVPSVHGGNPGVKLFNAGSEARRVSARRIYPGKAGTLKLLHTPESDDLIDVIVEPKEAVQIEFS